MTYSENQESEPAVLQICTRCARCKASARTNAFAMMDNWTAHFDLLETHKALRVLSLSQFAITTSHTPLATFRLQYEDDYEYDFSVLSTRCRFGGRKISKCACSELKARTRSRSCTPI